jgi:hypothetical protein
VVQVFLAGLGVFDDPARFRVHATWGYTLEILPRAAPNVAAGRLGRRMVLYPVARFVMFMLQSVLVGLRVDQPAVAALHPVNGFAILLVGIAQARDAWVAREGREGVAAAVARAADAGAR